VGAGGKSKESPQARPEYYPGYYATWVLDPDGHDIEVVHKKLMGHLAATHDRLLPGFG
jgi:hypothetical protein